MDNKPAQNIQDTFLNTVRKDKTPITIYLVSGVKLTGKIRSFDKYSVLLENNSQEQLIFKHAISTVVSNRSVMHTEHRPALTGWDRQPCRLPHLRRQARSSDKTGSALSWQLKAVPGAGLLQRRIPVGRDRPERAVLVGVDFTARPRATRAGLEGARQCGSACKRRIECEDDAGESTVPQKPAAIRQVLDADESLAEFRELVRSAGGEMAAELMQRRARPDPATLIGAGKVEEIAGVAASTNADLVLFDHDLTPTQLRNLEAALPCRVLDRTQLILDIFARHARTREGQLQVELAQLEYMLPRLTGRGKAMSQLGGGIGTRGPGETQLETDRREDSATHRPVEARSRCGAAGAPAATAAARGCAGADGGAGGLHQRGQEHAVQSAHGRAGAAVVAHVCDARSEAARD